MALLEQLEVLAQALTGDSQVWAAYTTVVRFIFPLLALGILAGVIRSLLTVPALPEVWGYLTLPNGGREALTHWENILGRAQSSDVVLNYPTVSRQHAALIRREDDSWTVYDLDSKGGIAVNGRSVSGECPLAYGDVLSLGGVETVLVPVEARERGSWQQRRRAGAPASPWLGLILLTVFQMLAAVQLATASEGEWALTTLGVFLMLILLMWGCCLGMRAAGRVGFEMETIAFFLSTLSLAVVASSAPESLVKQFISLVLGGGLFVVLGVLLRDLERVKKLRWGMAAMAIGLLAATVVFGTTLYGAKNWIRLGGLSLQPSELAKICYIFAGSATLERLFRRRNLGLFIVLTGACMGCLALMSDFGTAAIFFVTFLIIAYLRSGDWATLGLITGAAASGAALVVTVKPYIMSRFAAWGHAWENASVGSGYQQTRTMSAAASGGLVGVGAGEGWLHRVGAGDTDLVFGMLCEEWGLVIALLAAVSLITLAVFSVRACRTGRSSFYTIAACAASGLLVFQTCLNIFGAVDLLPLTGVTFPFVSNGGSSMLASWGLLAFLKATDTREGASFAIRLGGVRRGFLGEEVAG